MKSHAESVAGPSPPASFTPNGPVGDPAVAPAWASRLLFAAVVLVVGLPVAAAGRFIWIEWQNLREEERRAEATTVVGYPNIYPKASWALRPDPWFRIEGDTALVWSGWKPGQGHRWFRVNAGEIERRNLGEPLGRDVSQAIDYPVIENGGGPIWERIPESAEVVGLSLEGCSCAYPMGVLIKVLIVNDVIEDQPYLVYYDPFARPAAKVSIFDPRVDGRRITLGASGLVLGGRYVLYDRGTESLWVDDGRDLVAFAGKYRGKRLPVVSRVDPVAWDGWRDDHPGARLVVGSLDRTQALPTE